jgi:hypothetical protein
LPANSDSPTFLLPTPKVGEHSANVASKPLCIGFSGAANFRKNWIGIHGYSTRCIGQRNDKAFADGLGIADEGFDGRIGPLTRFEFG